MKINNVVRRKGRNNEGKKERIRRGKFMSSENS